MKKFIFITILAAFFDSFLWIVPSEAQSHRAQVERRHERRVTRRVVRRHAFYSSLPRYRVVVHRPPAGAVVVRGGGVAYHYHEGIFYKPVKDDFIVVRPALGVRVAVLPPARRVILIGNVRYYYYYGTFYKEHSGEYEVVEGPTGAVVDALPEGCEEKTVNGVDYYVLDDTYFQEIDTDQYSDGVGYKVVKL